MGSVWSDFLPKPEYDRTFGVSKFRDATEPSDEEKQSWVQDAIRKFREATKAAEEKQANLLAARQREEAKVPTPQEPGWERGYHPQEAYTETLPPGPENVPTLAQRFLMPLAPELPQAVRETPILGPTAEYLREWTSPAALAGAALMPGATAWMTGGGAAGKATEEALKEGGLPYQVPVGPINVGPSTVFTLAAPWAGPKVAKALPGAVRETMPAAREALVAGERGSAPLGPQIPEASDDAVIASLKARGIVDAKAVHGSLWKEGFTNQEIIDTPLDDLIKQMIQRRVAREAGGPRVPGGAGRTLEQVDADIEALRIELDSPKLRPAEKMELNFKWDRLWAERRRIVGETDIGIVEEGNIQAEEAGGDYWEAKVGAKPAPVPRVPEEPVSPDIASFRAATEPTAPITPGMSKAERLAQWKAGYKPETPAAAPEAPIRGPQPVGREEALARWRAGYEKPPGEPPKPPITEEVPPTGAIPPEDAAAKLIRLVKAAKPVRAETEALKHAELGRRAGAVGGVFGKEPGRPGLYMAKGQLWGETPKATFTPPESGLAPDEIDDLFNRVWRSEAEPFERLNTGTALEKTLLGQLPTRGEIALLEKQFGPELAKALLSRRGIGAKAWENLWDVLNLPRAVITAWDASAPMRQGIVLMMGHPKESFGNIIPMFRAMASEKYTVAVEKAIQTSKYAALRKEAGLYLAPRLGAAVQLTTREESFMSRFAQHIPGIKFSERAYVTYLNKLRADTFDTVAAGWEGLGKKPADYNALARYLNIATGRGDLGALQNLGPVLNAGFFAPRLVVSRIQLPIELLKTTPAVRKLMARDLVAFVGTGVGVLSMLKLSGLAEVELNPLSSDWGKGKVGPTRYDFWGGFQPIARYTAQLITGQRMTGGKEIMGIDRREVVGRFLQSKLSPQAGFLLDVWRGETFMGETMEPTPATIKTQAFNRLVPLFIQDITEAVRERGLLGGFTALPSGFGVGVQTYSTYGDKLNILARRYTVTPEYPQGRDWGDLGGVERKRLANEHPDVAEMWQGELEYAASREQTWGQQALQQRERDTTFEGEFLAALKDPQGRNAADLATSIRDYLQEQAQQNEVRYAGKEFDPRSDLERRMDDYYGAEMPTFPTPEEQTAFFDRQDTMLANDPELAQAVQDNQVLRFQSPEMRQFVALMWDAREVRDEYYSIPAKIGISSEEEAELAPWATQAAAMKSAYHYSPRRALDQLGLDADLAQRVLRYMNRADNPARARFWRENQDKHLLYKQFYSELPLDVPTEELAGVR